MAAPKTDPALRIWHYVPLPGCHTDDVIRHVDKLTELVLPWSHLAARRLAAASKPVPDSLSDSAELRAALAGALSRAIEWEGFAVAYELRLIDRWPADSELTNIIQRWSCRLKASAIAAWKARQAPKKPRARAA